MIEIMIEEIMPFLPLKVSTISWLDSQFQIKGEYWSFTTSGSWRITKEGKMLLGCFDKDSLRKAYELMDKIIIDIEYQDSRLKLDPIFIFSNNQALEIFSTNTTEPWTFQIAHVGIFIGTPSNPDTFYKKMTKLPSS